MKQNTKSQKLHPLWRLLAAVLTLAITGSQIVGYNVARAINLNYFHHSNVPVSPTDVFVGIFGLYLLVVALSGHWRLPRSGH